ncbi:hypothetical protein [Sphingobacterium sp. Mn56C]
MNTKTKSHKKMIPEIEGSTGLPIPQCTAASSCMLVHPDTCWSILWYRNP